VKKGRVEARPFSLFSSRESVQTASMDGQLLLLWHNPGVQAAATIIIGRQLVAGAVTPIERLRECGRSKPEDDNSGSHNEL
jgi:hypothetical protein